MKSKISFIILAAVLLTSACTLTPTLSTPNSPQEQQTAAITDHRRSFEGEYETRPNENIKIFLEADQLKIEGPGQPVMNLTPTEKENRFYLSEFDVHIEFVSESGLITKLLMIREDGQQLESPKVK